MKPPVWPKISLPLKLSELKALYRHFNKELFRNKLPKDIDLTISNKPIPAGEATLRNDYRVRYGISLSKSIMVSEEAIVGILIHEMVHVLMYVRYVETLDTKWGDAGHGPLFIAEVDRIIKKGYTVPYKENEGVLPDTLPYTTKFVLAVMDIPDTKGSTVLGFRPTKKMTKTDMERIKEHLEEDLEGKVLDVSTYISNSPIPLQFEPLDKYNRVPYELRDYLWYDDKVRQKILDKSTLLSTLKIETATPMEWPEKLIKRLSAKLHKIGQAEYYGIICKEALDMDDNHALGRLSNNVANKGIVRPAWIQKAKDTIRQTESADQLKFFEQTYAAPDSKKILRAHRKSVVESLQLLEDLIINDNVSMRKALSKPKIKEDRMVAKDLMVGRVPMPEITAYYMTAGLKTTEFERDVLNKIIKQYFS